LAGEEAMGVVRGEGCGVRRPCKRLLLPSTDYERTEVFKTHKWQFEQEQFQGKGIPLNINEKTPYWVMSTLHNYIPTNEFRFEFLRHQP